MYLDTTVRRAVSRGRAAAVFFLLTVFVFTGAHSLFGQESVLVAAQYSSLSLYDLNTLGLNEFVNAANFQSFVTVGPNPRLAFVGSSDYVSVIDLTLGREVDRIYGICTYNLGAFSSDGKLLLAEDGCSNSLDLIDAVALKVVKKISLSQAFGNTLTFGGAGGSVVVVGTTAYVTTTFTDGAHFSIAAVDLNTFVVNPISVPDGYVNFGGLWAPNAAVTPDGKYVAMIEDLTSDGSSHLLFIDTTSNKVVLDDALSFDPMGLLITPVNKPGSVYGYLLAIDTTGMFSATVLDLNPGSPTFGQLLLQTEVLLQSFFPYATSAAINPEGAKLIVGGYKPGKSSPNPNLVELDTALMLTDPSKAIVGQATVAGGVRPHGSVVAAVTTSPPPTAPTVTGVSSPITNDQDNIVHVTGTNFASGALVRFGTMPPLAATVNSSNSLDVTVPKNAPAAPRLDVVVTNPNSNGPPAQQYQSGLLKNGLTILATAAFQPKHQLGLFDSSIWSLSVFDFSQRAMLNVPNAVVPFGVSFNVDGQEVYGAAPGVRGLVATPEAVAWNAANDVVEAQILFSGVRGISSYVSASVLAASVNPATGKPVVFVPVLTFSSGKYDLSIEMVDTDSSSPTFNTVIRTLPAGLNSSHYLMLYGSAATSDGKYVYVTYQDNSGVGAIAIFDVLLGTATTVSTDSLRIPALQDNETYVTSDGKSLLLSGRGSNPSSSSIAVLDIGLDPKHPKFVTNIFGIASPTPGSVAGAPYFISWQVVGRRLFALENNQGAVMAFNFDRSKPDFSLLASYVVPHSHDLGYGIGVSPDGALIYVPVAGYDMITVLDANLLVAHQPPLITNIGTVPGPGQITVSPVAH